MGSYSDKYRKKFGGQGEDIAVKFLQEKEYTVLKRNFQIWGGEIDIIARDPETLEIVFVEVKTRSSEYWQYLDQTMTWEKKKFIKKAAARFLFYEKLEDSNWRIDFIGMIKDRQGKILKILHFQNVY